MISGREKGRQEKNKQGIGMKLFLLAVVAAGFMFAFTPFVTFFHEVGHALVAGLFGGHATITSANTTMVSIGVRDNPFVLAFGYGTSAIIYGILMRLGGKGSILYAFSVGGMISVIRSFFISTDLQINHNAAFVFIPLVAFMLYIGIKSGEKKLSPYQKKVKRYRKTVKAQRMREYKSPLTELAVVSEKKYGYNHYNDIVIE